MRVYFSHAMRGKAGNKATIKQEDSNCNVALELARKLRKACGEQLDLYVPAESEPFVRAAYESKYLTIPQILELDCKVLDGCDAIIVYVPKGDEMQGGRLVEHDHAIDNMKDVCVFSRLGSAVDFINERIVYNGGVAQDNSGE